MRLIHFALWTWFLLLVLASLLYIVFIHYDRNIYLPIDRDIIELQFSDVHLRYDKRNKQWFANELPADNTRIEAFIHTLQAPCRAQYRQADIQAPKPQTPFPIRINNQIFVIGAHQDLSTTHYFYGNEQVYLCHESIKAIAQQPIHTWLEEP